MFGKMRLLVGCRSGMTVKFASKFHHGNPFVRGLLFAGSAGGTVLFNAGAVSVARDPLWGAAQSTRICATPPLRERRRHVQRREAVAQGSCESDFPALPAAQTCQGHSLRGVVSSQCTQRAFCAALFIVTFTSHGGRKRQENYTVKRPLPCSSCFASACLLGAIPARRDTQKERMPGSPSERCTGRRPANWS